MYQLAIIQFYLPGGKGSTSFAFVVVEDGVTEVAPRERLRPTRRWQSKEIMDIGVGSMERVIDLHS